MRLEKVKELVVLCIFNERLSGRLQKGCKNKKNFKKLHEKVYFFYVGYFASFADDI